MAFKHCAYLDEGLSLGTWTEFIPVLPNQCVFIHLTNWHANSDVVVIHRHFESYADEVPPVRENKTGSE